MNLSQKEIIALLKPFFEKAKIYEKYSEAVIRPAKKGEEIVTKTSDGKETVNRADSGDYVLTNGTKAKEQYIISAEKLRERYKPTGEKTDKGNVYQAIGRCRGIKVDNKILKVLGVDEAFEFTAPWGEAMTCKKGDMLVTQDIYGSINEIYRIALREFKETYRPV